MAAELPPLGDGPRGSRAGVVPLHPTPRPLGAGAARGTCSLAVKLPPLGDRPRGSRAGVVPLHPTPRYRARGCSWDMQADRGFTTVARQVPRLAGLVRLPAAWPIQTAIRQQASWLATKASVILISRWPFALQKYPSHIEISNPQGVRLRAADCGEIEAFAFCAARQSSSRKHVILQGVSMPHADCGGEERR